jgi:hypothetical protein
MAIGSKVLGHLWSEAINTINYLISKGLTKENKEMTLE